MGREEPGTARGGLPPWAVVSTTRAAHIERVVALLDRWAELLEIPTIERTRWRQAGWLHDALRDAPLDDLRAWSGRDDSRGLVHGPAAAARARHEGVVDEELLHAVEHHTFGHADWGDLGLALYAADFLEPGRPFSPTERAALAARFPVERDAVIREVIAMRLAHADRRGRTLRPETIAFVRAWGP
jgi:2-amino-4-hydroxy-6-hydroxymethyldihydropteridine diphosphokinase